MLSLASERWHSLTHAYGIASNVPGLLRQLEEYPQRVEADSEPFFSLWSALCHQGDVYSASYAAAPIILDIAAKAPERITYDYLLLPVSIEISRASNSGPDIPAELAQDYFESLKAIPSIVGRISASRLDATFALTCAAAIAIAGGHPTLAEAILELEGRTAVEFLEWVQNR